MSKNEQANSGKEEQQLIGGILDDNDDNDVGPTSHEILRQQLEQQMNHGMKSAPPGLNFHPENTEEHPQILEDKDYYEFYMASHNPRLPKPIYNPAYAGVGQVDDDFVKEFSKKLHVQTQQNQQNPEQPQPQSKLQQPQQIKPQQNLLNPQGGFQPMGQQQIPNFSQNPMMFQQQQQQPPNLAQNFLGQQQQPQQQKYNQFNQQQPQQQSQNFQNFLTNNSGFGGNGNQPHQNQQQKSYGGFNQQGMGGGYNNNNHQQQGNQGGKYYNNFNQSNNNNNQQQNQQQNFYQQNNYQQQNQRQQQGGYGQFNNQGQNVYQNNQGQNQGQNFYGQMNQNQGQNQQYYKQGGNQQMNHMQQGGQQQKGYYNNWQNNPNKKNKTNNMVNKTIWEINNTKKDQVTFADLIANLISNCKDQYGSRQIQKQFDTASDDEKSLFFDKLRPKILDLIKDQFGNYVIQRLLEKGNISQKKEIFDVMRGNVCELSLHTYGCRVIQKALEELKDFSDIQNQIISELNVQIKRCILDQNGNHVIQKCFETTPSDKLKLIIHEVIQNIEEFSTHSYGCRVIQRILEFCKPNQVEETKEIYDKLMSNLIKLCECQYGNYIMQYILEKGPEDKKQRIFFLVKDHFSELSVNKFASNVTEKSLLYSDTNFKREVLNQLLKVNPQNNESGLIKLAKDQFGNFVIQKLYLRCDQQTKEKMYNYLKDPKVQEEVSINNYGKHVIMFLDKPNQTASHVNN